MIPLFTSHYSISRAIITLDEATEIKDNSPVSIFSIAEKYNIDPIFVVDNNFSGFIEAYENSRKIKKQLVFGLKLVVCDDIEKKDEESFITESKVIVFLKNSAAYSDAVKIYSKAATDGFYYIPRIDWKRLNELWTDNLLLAVPFYDSFLYNNTLTYKCSIVPKFEKMRPVFFTSETGLPFDGLVRDVVKQYTADNGYELLESHNINYFKDSDIEAYQVFRCIGRRSNLQKPQLNAFSSCGFSFESYLKKVGKNL